MRVIAEKLGVGYELILPIVIQVKNKVFLGYQKERFFDR